MLQVDDTPPSVSRSGKSIDLFQSGPISSIGNNAPTLAAIMHRGVRLKKVTTRRTQISPSVAASTLAQAFKVHLQTFYTDFTLISVALVLTNLPFCISTPAHRQGPEAGSIISSVVSSIQTSTAPPQGNTLPMKSLLMNSFLLSYNYFRYSFS